MGEMILVLKKQMVRHAGDFLLTGDQYLKDDNEWYTLTQRVKLNNPGENDGEIDIWYDDAQALEAKGIYFRDVSELKVNGVSFSVGHGGNTRERAPSKDMFMDFADFTISNAPLK